MEELAYFTKFPRKQFLMWKYEFKNCFLKPFKLYKNVKDNFSFKHVENPIVSIIIPVYNQYQYTINCLYSILKTVQNIDYEIIIADDCSTDKTQDIVKKIGNIKVVKTPQNMGFLKNCNNVASHAKGEFIWLLNNDTQIQHKTLSSLLNVFKIKKDVGVVGSKLIYPNGNLQEAGGIIYNDATGCNFGKGKMHFDRTFNYLKEVDYCSGASLFMKKDFWNKLGGFDENFVPAYYEETDLCFRVRQAGLKVYYQPQSLVVHFESISLSGSHDLLMKQNGEKFRKKWVGELKKQCPPNDDNFLARDRSQNKKTLLFIDDNILRPDTNCGERNSFQYLEFFVSLGFNVKFLPKNTLLNENKYVDDIEQLGVEVVFFERKMSAENTNYAKEWLSKHGKYIDYVFINRPHVYEHFIPLIKKYCKPKSIHYQGHDINYLREERQARINSDPESKVNCNINKVLEPRIWNDADYVYYFSDKEIELVKKSVSNANAKSIPLYLYDEPKKISYEKERKDLLFVGGFAHTPNVDAMNWFIDEIFPIVKKEILEIKINIVGSKAPQELVNKQNADIIFKGYVTDEELEKLYKTSRLTVVPLRYGAGVKGKIIESLMYQVPVITTEIGIEGIPNAQNIIAQADTIEEFAKKIVELYDNYDSLKKMSDSSLDYIKKYFSKKTALEILKSDFCIEAEGILRSEK